MTAANTTSSGSSSPLGVGQPSKAVTKVKDGIDSANDAAGKALKGVSQKVDAVRNDLTPIVKQGAEQAQTMMDQSMEALRDAAEVVRVRAQDATEQVAAYTKEEPIKALLIAAAVGAGLMGLFSLMMRSGD